MSKTNKSLTEGIVDKIFKLLYSGQPEEIKKSFANDKELQKDLIDVNKAIAKAKKSADDYCKKYDCSKLK